MAETLATPRLLDEAVVEMIVRWYQLSEGAVGANPLLAAALYGARGRSSAPRDVHAEVALVLAECPHRVPAGNPFHDDATITPVERRVIAELAYERSARLVRMHEAVDALEQGSRLARGERVLASLATVETMREANLWKRMEGVYAAHALWRPAMDWLRWRFAVVVHGDPGRGLRGDASFLPFIEAADRGWCESC